MSPKTEHLTPTSRLLHITQLCVPASSKALVYSCPPQKCYCIGTWPAQCSQMPSRMVQRRTALHTLRRWEYLWGCVGRWFLIHTICLQELLMLVTAAAGKTHSSETARPSAVNTELLLWQSVSLRCPLIPFWQVMFSHCSMLWHHPARSSLTIHGQIRWKVPQAISWLQ